MNFQLSLRSDPLPPLLQHNANIMMTTTIITHADGFAHHTHAVNGKPNGIRPVQTPDGTTCMSEKPPDRQRSPPPPPPIVPKSTYQNSNEHLDGQAYTITKHRTLPAHDELQSINEKPQDPPRSPTTGPKSTYQPTNEQLDGQPFTNTRPPNLYRAPTVVPKGSRVEEGHENFEIMYNMLSGIRFSVSRNQAKMDRPLTDADFDTCNKTAFDGLGSEITPSSKYEFKFKDYAPWVFRHLRNKFGIDPGDYLMSLTAKYILSELSSPGKSKSFFYFSRDYKYIIKTIHPGEHKFLRRILKEYYEHVENNPNTLLSQFYGLHRVKLPYGRKIHFVVMNNLMPPHKDIHGLYDLKGSTVGRDYPEAKLKEKLDGGEMHPTLKDLNWLRRSLNLELGPIKRDAFLQQLQKDVTLLQRLNVMDYSLLVAMHDVPRGNRDNLRDRTLQVFHPSPEVSAEAAEQPGAITRTQSKLDHARRVHDLRQSVRKARTVTLEAATESMPEESDRTGYFYKDDGGLRATNSDNSPSSVIYYLGVIDCLTRYTTVKKLEHWWKGFKDDKMKISPIPPQGYGERFLKFIGSITKGADVARRDREDRGSGQDVWLPRVQSMNGEPR